MVTASRMQNIVQIRKKIIYICDPFFCLFLQFFQKAPPEMGSRLDPAFGGLGVGAPGWYLFGGSFFRISRVAAFFH